MYAININAILAKPFKKSESEQLRAAKKLQEYLMEIGFPSKAHILDNECIQAIKKYMRVKN